MNKKASSIRVQDIDHSGIVAGIIDEMGLVEQINQELGSHPQEIISAGAVVKAMIINGLGFVSAPLYMFEKFFVGKATEDLLGEGIEAKHLNDDRLGRVLDQLWEKGLTSLYVKVALGAAAKFGINKESLHLDSSSFSVQGVYEASEKEIISEEGGGIRITHGYSRDKRPDLKQFMVDLMCSGDGDVPLYLRVGNGNESDQGIFAKLIKEFREEWDCEALFVADAALYSKENLESLVNLRWLSRVPAKIKEAQQLMEQLSDEALESSKLEGYRYSCACSTYSGIKQRWLTVESEERKKSDLKKLEEKIEEDEKSVQKQLQSLSQQEFACAEDALAAGMKWSKKLIYHRLETLEAIAIPYYRKAGRPKKDQVPDGYRYHLQGSLTQNEETIALARAKAGRFVLATNVLDSESLSNEQILCEYKAQQSTERGFRFLKDPMFFTSSVFLKTPERIAALAMVMGLCLLVYTLAQRALRQALTQAKQTIPNQLGKPTATPTMRWVFQCFQSIHLLALDGVQQIINLTMEHRHIIQFLGSSCQKYYLLV